LKGINKILNSIQNFLSPEKEKEVKNLMLNSVDNVELDFGAEVETREQVIAGVTNVTANGEAANGPHILPTGETLNFADGTLTEVIEAETETEKLNKENETLKAELLDVQNKVKEITEERDLIENSRIELEAKVKNELEPAVKRLAEIQNSFSEVKAEDKAPAITEEKSKSKLSFNFKK